MDSHLVHASAGVVRCCEAVIKSVPDRMQMCVQWILADC